MASKKSAYASAGVDIDEKMKVFRTVRKSIKSTSQPGLIGGIGAFGGMFAAPGKDKVLIASTDSVGTKLKVAVMTGRHYTVGQDIVNHCVNDILVHGAKPLFFLDYYGTARFEGRIFKAVVAGLCKACRENDCVLVGGETAEMPGLYPEGEYDLVGTIVGAVDRKKIITGMSIRPGDVIIGLPSSGLHTNGYSLARKVIFGKAKLGINDKFPGTGKSVADILLVVHKSYLRPVTELTRKVNVQGMAHITGGGFVDNVVRILHGRTDAVFDRAAWGVPPVFRFIQEHGKVARDEMYRVFNMGIGLVIIVRPAIEERALRILRGDGARPVKIGCIERGAGAVRLIN